MKEITLEELKKLNRDDYELIDIRDEGPRTYGMMPGAIAIPLETEFEKSVEMIAEIPMEKKLIFYCDFGRKTAVLDDFLRVVSTGARKHCARGLAACAQFKRAVADLVILYRRAVHEAERAAVEDVVGIRFGDYVPISACITVRRKLCAAM